MRAENEVAILRDLKHAHIVLMYEAVTFATSIILVLENCTHGDLVRNAVLTGPMTEAVVFRTIVKQILQALHALHAEVCTPPRRCLSAAQHRAPRPFRWIDTRHQPHLRSANSHLQCRSPYLPDQSDHLSDMPASDPR